MQTLVSWVSVVGTSLIQGELSEFFSGAGVWVGALALESGHDAGNVDVCVNVVMCMGVGVYVTSSWRC